MHSTVRKKLKIKENMLSITANQHMVIYDAQTKQKIILEEYKENRNAK